LAFGVNTVQLRHFKSSFPRKHTNVILRGAKRVILREVAGRRIHATVDEDTPHGFRDYARNDDIMGLRA